MSRQVWWAQFRGKHVYCLKASATPNALPVEAMQGVGFIEEVRCPASAYADEPKPHVRVPLFAYPLEGMYRRRGVVELTAVGPRRTRVVVTSPADVAWIETGTCERGTANRVFDLSKDFFSFRSVTLVPAPLRTLVEKPHALYLDAGGAHGGDPIGCANL